MHVDKREFESTFNIVCSRDIEMKDKKTSACHEEISPPAKAANRSGQAILPSGKIFYISMRTTMRKLKNYWPHKLL